MIALKQFVCKEPDVSHSSEHYRQTNAECVPVAHCALTTTVHVFTPVRRPYAHHVSGAAPPRLFAYTPVQFQRLLVGLGLNAAFGTEAAPLPKLEHHDT